ncbi:MAG TPA: molybdenum cofactor biosynthesis protein MoaE [Phycisphaerales bacterium]|nr:molybdenum cofactor biosynthesis protein MoaE [Phycisphaerales bacterium]
MTALEPLLDVQLLHHPVTVIPFDPFPSPAGAECIFLGRTRMETHPVHGVLRRLSYEAYESMAINILNELARSSVHQHGTMAIRLHHALGEVPIGCASVLVQVVAGHRDMAFQSCRFLIDQLKSRAPVWKREVWADGTTWSQGIPVIPIHSKAVS